MAKTRITLASIHKEQLATRQQLAVLTALVQGSLERSDRVESSLNQRMDRVETSLNQRMDRVESSLQLVHAKLDEHARELKGLQERVDTLHGLMENLLVRTERLEQEYTMITAGLKRLETRFDELEAARLRQRIEALERRVAALEAIEN